MTVADGREVVDSLEGVSSGPPPLLVLDRVRDYFDAQGLGAGPLSWKRVGDGQSNITYKITRGQDEFVLRRGPRPPLPRSAHDMVREAKTLCALRPPGVPVPEVLAICEDETLLGVPFYVMAWLEGEVLTDVLPAVLHAEQQRRATSEQLVDTLVTLHHVDVTLPGVAALGRPDGYLARQISRFAGLWGTVGGRDLPEVARLADWLERHRPATQRTVVVHGDYRLGNLMFHPSAVPTRALAVLDWEMATLGDPLSDLGYLVATYSEPATPWNPLLLSPVTALPGFSSRAELVARYADATGLDVSALDWYRALALWKGAVFCEAIYARWRRGERPGDAFGPTLEAGVPALLAQAALLAA